VAPEVGADLEPGVLEAVERGRDQAVALQVAVVLALEVGELAEPGVEPERVGQPRGSLPKRIQSSSTSISRSLEVGLRS